jgi:exodeoxyribonuclease VII small subunit
MESGDKVTPGVAQGPDLQAMFDNLRQICDQLENGGLTLEESIELHESGVKLQEQIRAALHSAERRVVQLVDETGLTSFDVEVDGRRRTER